MKQETINKRIESAFNKHDYLKKASQSVRDYFKEIIILMFNNLESDVEKEADYHSSTENLRFAIEVNIYDEFSALLEEAQAQ